MKSLMKSSVPSSTRMMSLASAQERRGNTIVLVTGILVLLVIIATAYVSRTQAGRITATSATTAGLRQDLQQVIAEMIAAETAEALFVRPVNAVPAATYDFTVAANSDATRLLPDINSVRHGIDPFFPYNFAPYEVSPRTNWPDALWNTPAGTFVLPNPNQWPSGAGNPNPFLPTLYWLAAEDNPFGNPGFGDTRWLRSFEPLRIDLNNDLIDESFSHWRHMTNIARPDNGWRVCFDISDIEGMGVVDNLNIPIEQWTIFTPPGANPVTGHYVFQNNFEALWDAWFTLGGYAAALQNPLLAPPNYYKLSDLNGDGLRHNFGDLPDDEFFFGSARNRVSRRLADADGDGFTDSFWYLVPSPVHSGIRTVVAVTIIDNSSMLNANVGTRFMANDLPSIPSGLKRTAGVVPTDLAMVGQLISGIQASNGNVGFYDNPDHDLHGGPNAFDYWIDPTTAAQTRWSRHLSEVGLPAYASTPPLALTAQDRLDYWLKAASRPVSDVVPSRYTPFGLPDEIELRASAGRNTPWILSRFEHSVQSENSGGSPPDNQQNFLRSSTGREETSEFGDSWVSNQLLVSDPRHRLTLYSAARNDIMPPYLWRYGNNIDTNADGEVNAFDDLNGDGFVDNLDLAIFHRAMQKFDLRQTYGQTLDGDFNPANNPPLPAAPILETETTLAANPSRANLLWGIVLRDRLTQALMDETGNVNIPTPNSYYGNTPADRDKTRELAAGTAATIVQRRDKTAAVLPAVGIETSPLVETVPVVGLEVPPGTTTPRMMGLEPQPFLLEAFIGHVYKGVIIPDGDLEGDPYLNAGGYVVLEENPVATSGGNRRTTVIAVQIANPFDTQLNLEDYQISVFGQAYDIPNLILPPAAEELPSTAIFYAIANNGFDTDQNPDPPPGDPTMLQFNTRWLHFLSLLPADLNLTGSIAQDVNAVSVVWSTSDRGVYDTNEDGIELLRTDYGDIADPADDQQVVIDRFDDPNEPDTQKFSEQVNNLGATAIDVEPDPLNSPDVPPVGAPYPLGIPLEPNGPESGNRFRHWVQWARVTRAWGADRNNDGVYDQNEKSPRFVFGDKAISTARETTLPTGTLVANGNKYRFDDAPDALDVNVDPPVSSLWFSRDYIGPSGIGGAHVVRTGKPTFFNMRPRDPMATPIPNFPDKGWYSQPGGVDGPVNAPTDLRLGFPFQMLHKDGEYEQIGEVLNTLCYGHKIDATQDPVTGDITYVGTIKTFSEYLNPEVENEQLVGDDVFVNRLRGTPQTVAGATMGNILGVGLAVNIGDPRHSYPDLPAAARLFDGLVCDGPGLTGTYGVDNFSNAMGFERFGTPGLININDAPIEVMRSLPHWYRLFHENGTMTDAGLPQLYNYSQQPLVTNGTDPTAMLPRSMLAEAVLMYREKFNGLDPIAVPFASGIQSGPNYEARPGGRGIASIGELLSLTALGDQDVAYAPFGGGPPDNVYREQWRIDMGLTDPDIANPKPFVSSPDPATRKQVSARLSTDRIDGYDSTAPTVKRRDLVAGDAEEANMLFAGASNLITTRSDTFTVYFKVRSFRQNTSVTPPVWDATNKDYIVDDSRYVMLVDRSGVNKPGDKPRILYLEKLPN